MGRSLTKIKALVHFGKSRLFTMIALFMLASVIEIIGLSVIAPYLSIIIDEKNSEYIAKSISIFPYLPIDRNNLIILLSYILIGFFFARFLIATLVNYTIVSFSMEQQALLQTTLMKMYQSLSYFEYIRRNSSEYIYNIEVLATRFTGDVLIGLIKAASDAIIAISILIFLAWIDIFSLVLFFILAGLLSFVHRRFLHKKIRTQGVKVNISANNMIQGINEGIEGLKDIRILGCEEYFNKKVSKWSTKYAKNLIYSSVINAVFRNMIELVIVIFIASSVLFSLAFQGSVESLIPTLGVFSIAAIRLIPVISNFSNIMVILRFNQDSISTLYSDVTATHPYEAFSGTNIKSTEPFNMLTLKNVSFSYSETDKYSLNDISMKIHSGESIGIIGASGSGKTTLVNILLGFHTPEKGEVIFNDHRLEDSILNWRRHIAYIPQQIFLINDTLRKNIALGLDDEDINNELIEVVLKIAQLSELIKILPNGINTIIGEKGDRLSGGQRQRIALARALYYERDVIVMDEATSSLDSENEYKIMSEINAMKGNRTMIIITHRLSIVRECDRVYRLKDGKIIACGPPQAIIV